jgi:hypothetical protein
MEEHSKHETGAVDCLKRTKTGKVEIAGGTSDGQNPSNIALCELRRQTFALIFDRVE